MQKSLGSNAILNTIRQSLTIIFPLITFPYVSRVLGAEEFGRYTFAASVVSYFQLLAAFGISTYGIREGALCRRERKKISKLASDLFNVNILTCTVAYVCLILLLVLNPKVKSYCTLIMIQSLCMVLTLLGLDWINNVFEDFIYITIRYFLIQIVALVSIFFFVRSSADTAKYCLILILGSYGGNIINLFYIRRYIDLPRPKKTQLGKYTLPLFILFINSLATTIYVNSDSTMIGIFLSNIDVGLYGFASKIYNILKYFINSAVVVTIPRLAALVNTHKEEYITVLEKTLYALIVFLFPISAGLFMLSKKIIIVVGGNDYIAGYLPLKILSFSLIFALLASICTNCILIIHKREKRVLTATAVSASVNVLLNLYIIPLVGICGAAITTVIAEMLNLAIQFWFIHKDLDIKISFDRRNVFSVVIGVGEVVFGCIVASIIWRRDTVGDSIKSIVLAIFVSSLLYFPTLIVFKNNIVMSLVKRNTDEM